MASRIYPPIHRGLGPSCYDQPDEPMTFIGQLEIPDDLRQVVPIWPIEPPGLLSFFCLKDDQTDEIFGAAKVLLTAGQERLCPHELPADLAARNRLGELQLHTEPMLTLPYIGSDRFADLGVEDRGAYQRILTAPTRSVRACGMSGTGP